MGTLVHEQGSAGYSSCFIENRLSYSNDKGEAAKSEKFKFCQAYEHSCLSVTIVQAVNAAPSVIEQIEGIFEVTSEERNSEVHCNFATLVVTEVFKDFELSLRLN